MIRAKFGIRADDILGPIDDRLYSSFVEHMGRAVYTGIYEPTHKTADKNGFREDVKALIRPLRLSHVRYPGGNFVSGYHWRDGVGPREKRPIRRDLAWQATEPNLVGVDEFCDWAEELGVQPMLAVNLGTGTPEEAVSLLQYMNAPEGSCFEAQEREQNGRLEPRNIKLWCLGNEMDGPWQICRKTAMEYARIAHETAKMMKWADPSVELVACGSSNRDMPTFGDWERTVLLECWDSIDYLSLHTYYQNTTGDDMSFLARSEQMARFIDEVYAIIADVAREKKSDKRIYLSFDEWNVWYHFQNEQKAPEKWTCPRAIEEENYNFLDALAVGAMLTTLINRADKVKIACLAQLINVLAPITTVPGGAAYRQTIYWPFLHAAMYGRGTALNVRVIDMPTYDCEAEQAAPYIACAAVLSPDGREVTLFAVNKSMNESARLNAEGLTGRMIERIVLSAPPDARNTPDREAATPLTLPVSPLDCVILPPASWNVIRIAL